MLDKNTTKNMRTILISKTQPKFDNIQNASVLIVVVCGSNEEYKISHFPKNALPKQVNKSAHTAAPNLMFFKTGKITLSEESCSHEIHECSS